MLAAIAVLAIAGGVYASKAARTDTFVYIPSTAGGVCTSTLFGVTTLPNTFPGTVVRSATLVTSSTCALKTIYTTD